jgi:hypothetical protein
MTTLTFPTVATQIAQDTQDAYSADRYGVIEWTHAADLCLRRGMTPAQVNAVLRSKHMRYAADVSIDPENPTADDLGRFMANYPLHFTTPALNALVEGTEA